MCSCWNIPTGQRSRPVVTVLGVIAIAFGLASLAQTQTPSTGAVTGTTLDVSGAILPGVVMHLSNSNKGEDRSVTSDYEGRFAIPLLPPGDYQLQADKADFGALSVKYLHVSVTETLRVRLYLGISKRFESVVVSSKPTMVQMDTSAL